MKPLRDGWLDGSDVGGLSTMEVKTDTSVAQSIVLIGVVAGYARPGPPPVDGTSTAV